MAGQEFDYLIRSLSHRDRLSEVEQALIKNLPRRRQVFDKGEALVMENSRPTESCLVVQGFVAREVHFADGRRQLTAVHVPGDFVDLHGMLLKTMDHSVVALSPCQAFFVAHRHLLELVDKAPHLGRLLWLSTLIDAAIQRAWITSMGRRSAVGHLAHLFCEVYLRLEAVGLAANGSFEFPIKQAELADMLGMSLVHANRSVMRLRATGLIRWDGMTVTVLDFEGLSKIAEFDATFLNYVREPR